MSFGAGCGRSNLILNVDRSLSFTEIAIHSNTRGAQYPPPFHVICSRLPKFRLDCRPLTKLPQRHIITTTRKCDRSSVSLTLWLIEYIKPSTSMYLPRPRRSVTLTASCKVPGKRKSDCPKNSAEMMWPFGCVRKRLRAWSGVSPKGLMDE